jgi:DNA-binding helix-hairpin-helix protein with protein kinase domain
LDDRAMTETFVTGKGKTIAIGREVGKGGEGAVYEIPSDNHLVAKLYNSAHQPDAQKQAKLRFMAASVDEDLLKYAAWPQDTLHKTHNGPVIGFLMPKVVGRTQIHMLYSPAHRKQDYPQAAWDFLVFAARNTAAAFDAIHRHGHVLGDVNQKNVLVGADSKVVLIDADSFQVNADGSVHLCKVGVPEFTPPELQGSASFDREPRTSNHDNFGLALLMFHLLLGGRHPYSGIPLKKNIDESLEKDIQAFRYAYALDSKQRGIEPPPRSIPIAVLPDPIQALFTCAFTEKGANAGRPSAQQWVAALDGLRGQLKRCAETSMHVYPRHLSLCPWCALEDQGVMYFLHIRASSSSTGTSDFVLAKVWAAIESVQPPTSIGVPNVAAVAATPNPLPPGLKLQGSIIFWRLITIAAALWLIFEFPGKWFLILPGAWLAWKAVNSLEAGERKAERTRRKAARDMAQKEFDEIVRRLQKEYLSEEFDKKKQYLARLRDEYQQLLDREKSALDNLLKSAPERQKLQFLERQFIDAAKIPGVGLTKKAALLSFGIETAADATWDKVISVKGFGEVLTSAVMDWRKACERRFVFDPSIAMTEADKIATLAPIAARKCAIEAQLNTGAADLKRLRQDAVNTAIAMGPQLQAAILKLAQARADLKVI